MIATLRRLIASLLVICIAVPLPSQAAILATDTALAAVQRDQVNLLLERADVQARLPDFGLKAAVCKSPLPSLTDINISYIPPKNYPQPTLATTHSSRSSSVL